MCSAPLCCSCSHHGYCCYISSTGQAQCHRVQVLLDAGWAVRHLSCLVFHSASWGTYLCPYAFHYTCTCWWRPLGALPEVLFPLNIDCLYTFECFSATLFILSIIYLLSSSLCMYLGMIILLPLILPYLLEWVHCLYDGLVLEICIDLLADPPYPEVVSPSSYHHILYVSDLWIFL